MQAKQTSADEPFISPAEFSSHPVSRVISKRWCNRKTSGRAEPDFSALVINCLPVSARGLVGGACAQWLDLRGEERIHITIQIPWLRILRSSFSAKESVTSAETSLSERKETEQEEKSRQFPQKGSEPFEKQAA